MTSFPGGTFCQFIGRHLAIGSLAVSLSAWCFAIQAANAQSQPRPIDGEYSEQETLEKIGLPKDSRSKMNSALTDRIAQIDRVCKLSQDQKKKLRLMGQGDIKRFFDQVRVCKTNFEEHRGLASALGLTVESDLFHDGSLFCKAIPNVLNMQQIGFHEPLAEETRRRRKEKTIKALLNSLEQELPFEEGEREQITNLLKELPPPGSDGQAGMICQALRLIAIARNQPQRFQNEQRREWFMTVVNDELKEIEPYFRYAGYLPQED